MKIITTTGYYGTGSSAITDLLYEYDDVYNITDYEFRFVQDPDGLSDLEFKLVQNNHRHNSGHALKVYKRKVDFLNGNKLIKKYNRFFGNVWKEESYKYIESLTNFKYQGYWHQDVIDKGKIFNFRKRFINKILQKTIWRGQERNYNEMPKEVTLVSYPSEQLFLSETKKYTESLFKKINIYNKKYVMVDQIVASSNISRYTRYFNDIKVFLIDRDPRDLFLLEKYIWKGKVIPVGSVESFCEWFKLSREHRKTEVFGDNVMFLYFEDLIYKYKETISKIELWLDLKPSNDMNKRIFNPEESIKNTKIWINYPNESDNIDYITKTLGEYLYE